MTTTEPTVDQEPAALFERIGHVALITFNRPAVMNAINPAMAAAVGDAVNEFVADPDLRIGVITGAGRAFSAGADLKAAAAKRPMVAPGQGRQGLAGILKQLIDKPLIAAVNGYALGGGTEIALACDLIVMSEDAKLGLPEVTRGIIASAGGLIRLPRQIPQRIALEMVLTGAPIDAVTALQWGLANRVVPADQVVDTALELANVIAANAPLAVQHSKRLLHQALAAGSDWEPGVWELNRAANTAILHSDDAKEGRRAFAEKRTPVWTGR